MNCKICNADDDLFSAVTQEPACSICVLRFGLRTPVQQSQVVAVREQLGLEEGEFLRQDRGALAGAFLRRRTR